MVLLWQWRWLWYFKTWLMYRQTATWGKSYLTPLITTFTAHAARPAPNWDKPSSFATHKIQIQTSTDEIQNWQNSKYENNYHVEDNDGEKSSLKMLAVVNRSIWFCHSSMTSAQNKLPLLQNLCLTKARHSGWAATQYIPMAVVVATLCWDLGGQYYWQHR